VWKWKQKVVKWCNNIISCEFIWIRIRRVTIFSWMLTVACMLYSSRVGAMIIFSVWLVSNYAHVFLLHSVVISFIWKHVNWNENVWNDVRHWNYTRRQSGQILVGAQCVNGRFTGVKPASTEPLCGDQKTPACCMRPRYNQPWDFHYDSLSGRTPRKCCGGGCPLFPSSRRVREIQHN